MLYSGLVGEASAWGPQLHTMGFGPGDPHPRLLRISPPYGTAKRTLIASAVATFLAATRSPRSHARINVPDAASGDVWGSGGSAIVVVVWGTVV
jgi:hypothetical protein